MVAVSEPGGADDQPAAKKILFESRVEGFARFGLEIDVAVIGVEEFVQAGRPEAGAVIDLQPGTLGFQLVEQSRAVGEPVAEGFMGVVAKAAVDDQGRVEQPELAVQVPGVIVRGLIVGRLVFRRFLPKGVAASHREGVEVEGVPPVDEPGDGVDARVVPGRVGILGSILFSGQR